MQFNVTEQTTFHASKRLPKLNQKIRAEVIFGSPRNKCSGVGICKVITISRTARFQIVRHSCKKTLAFITVTEQKRVKFSFLKLSMCERALATYFSDRIFIMTEKFSLPKEIVSQLGLAFRKLPSGLYPVMETGQFLVVVF